MTPMPEIVKRAASYAWAFWTTARASAEYVAGRIDSDEWHTDEWHTRVGIARLTVGKEVPDLYGDTGDDPDGH